MNKLLNSLSPPPFLTVGALLCALGVFTVAAWVKPLDKGADYGQPLIAPCTKTATVLP